MWRSSGARYDPVKLAVQCALGLKQFVAGLEAEEKAFGHPVIARQPEIQLGTHSTITTDYLLDALSLDIECRGQIGNADGSRLHEFQPQHLAGVRIRQPILGIDRPVISRDSR